MVESPHEPWSKPVAPSDRRDAVATLLQRRADRYGRPNARGDAEVESLVHFTRAGSSFAVSISELTTIRRVSSLTIIPGVSGVVRGVVSIGGRVIGVHDLAFAMGLAADLPPELWLLVGADACGDMALLADSVTQVSAEAGESWDPAPVSSSLPAAALRGVRQRVLWLRLASLRASPAFFCA